MTGYEFLRGAFCALALSALPGAGFAGGSWDDIRSMLFDGREIHADAGAIDLMVPYRATDDTRTRMGARIALPGGERIKKVYLIVDENPMPVSAVFEMEQARSEFAFDLTMRLNGPSGIHLVVETQDGSLLVSEEFAKTSGLGACAAPPGTDPVLALESLGQMDFALVAAESDLMAKLSELGGGTAPPVVSTEAQALRAAVSFSHPSHSGLQMDQITLLYLPARYIETVELSADGQPVYTMTGSITLSENPVLTTDLPLGAESILVRMIDTDGASFERDFHLGQG